HLVVVMMDEYLEPGDVIREPRRVDPTLAHSCVRFAEREIVGRLNAAASAGRRVTPDRLWVPDPADPGQFDTRIADIGGVEVFSIASGASDGRIAFNPAGTPPDTRTRVVALTEQPRRDNLATFPSFQGQLDRVPTHGVTVGIGTIREHSKRVVMVVHGADK